MKQYFVKFRKAAKMSQKELALKLGISRPTLIALEKGERDVTLGELKKLCEIFDVPIEFIVDDSLSISEKMNARDFGAQSMKRFQNLVLQCVKYGADSDGKITKTKLAKLVYLCDFACYYHFLKPISGMRYCKMPQGPVTMEFFDLMENGEAVAIESKGRAQMVSLVEKPDESVFSKQENDLIKAVCAKWKKAKTDELVAFTHDQIPWKACKDREVIPYALINNEEAGHVY